MEHTFDGASSFNQPIGKWNTGKVTTMRGMFKGASSFDQPIGSWNTSLVENMYETFDSAVAFNQDLRSWNINAVTTMQYMFFEATAFNQDLCWDISSSVTTTDMFSYSSGSAGCPPTSPPTPSPTLAPTPSPTLAPTVSPAPTPASYTFTSKAELQTAVDLWCSDQSAAATTYGPIASWGTSLITDMSNLFYDKDTFNDDIGSWNTPRSRPWRHVLGRRGVQGELSGESLCSRRQDSRPQRIKSISPSQGTRPARCRKRRP